MHRTVERHYRVDQAAQKLGFRPITIRRWISRGDITPARLLGKAILIPESTLERVRMRLLPQMERRAWRRDAYATADASMAREGWESDAQHPGGEA